MVSYFLRRLFSVAVILFFVSFLTFVIFSSSHLILPS